MLLGVVSRLCTAAKYVRRLHAPAYTCAHLHKVCTRTRAPGCAVVGIYGPSIVMLAQYGMTWRCQHGHDGTMTRWEHGTIQHGALTTTIRVARRSFILRIEEALVYMLVNFHSSGLVTDRTHCRFDCQLLSNHFCLRGGSSCSSRARAHVGIKNSTPACARTCCCQ